MNFKRILLQLIFGVICFVILFEEQGNAMAKQSIAVVFLTKDGGPTEEVYYWEATFSAFASEIDLFSVSDVEEKELLNKDAVVFIGAHEEILPASFVEAMNQFKGKVILFGYNAKQLQPYASWRFTGEKKIRSLNGQSLKEVQTIVGLQAPSTSRVLASGKTLHEEVPYIVQNGRFTYIASSAASFEMKIAVAKEISRLLQLSMPDQHDAFIQLEGVSPLTDATVVEEMSDYLFERSIPFTIAVTPVYLNEENGAQTHLRENKALIKVLQDIQQRGGRIVAHGYDHVYRPINGMQVEFWDALYNQKIRTLNIDEPVLPIKHPSMYPSFQHYEKELAFINEQEAQYIRNKLSASIEAFVQEQLYPIALKVPHDAMSHHGYTIASDYFTSIFGNIQMSDSDWQKRDAPLFITKPLITNRIVVFPTTLGAPNYESENPLQEMKRKLDDLTAVQGTVLGTVFNIHEDVDILEQVVDLIQAVRHVQWLDIKNTDQFVQTDDVTIEQKKGEEIRVKSSLSSLKMMTKRIKNNPFEAVLWGVAFIVIVFLILFFLYVSSLRIRLRKRLFEERELDG